MNKNKKLNFFIFFSFDKLKKMQNFISNNFDVNSNNDNFNFRTSYNMAFSKPNYNMYSSKSRNDIYNNNINGINYNLKNQFKTSNEDSENIKKLVCPDCYNKNFSQDRKDSYSNIINNDRYVGKSFVDNLNKQDEKLIKDRIKQREHLSIRAGEYIKNMRDYNINRLQTENENANFFDKNKEYGILRAQKRDYLNNNYVIDNINKYSSLENPKVKDYYKKYVTNKKEEQLIKERPLSMSREEYKKMMLNQMEQSKKLKNERAYNERKENERIITYQMNNDKRKIEEENEKRRQEINYYQDENLKLLYSKKLRDKAEENDRKYEENKIIRENKREIEKENENARKRRQDYVNLNEENYRNYKLKKQNEERLKELEKNRNYPDLCIHGCKMGKCDICNKMFPERVLTRVLYKKRSKTTGK